ncbi:DUF397 domain-containing protein [Virgisporangium aliadipatigenens]|uniref:DUF397 domain-containing protein n=1 Tax=Virgisporangium aliadipatigenens TaxID=741659 RepID=UPI0019450B8B|nr:DUF397 domain-containing protein [Virgisporangium aliadipatigenens]
MVRPGLNWRKSSYSASSNCIEIAFSDDTVLVRDSKDKDGGILDFTPAQWISFVRAAGAGEFSRKPAE